MLYLAAGYAVFWLISFALIYSMLSRQRRLTQELEMLERLVAEQTEEDEAVTNL
jgi:hypothetical protein